MQDYAQYIRHLVSQGGPREADYIELDDWVVDVHDASRAGEISADEMGHIRAAFGDALSPETMQGFAFAKPHGYAGDFEIIDRIYHSYVCPQPHLAAWDHFYHQHPAPKAVRNRKEYFHRLLDKHVARKQPLRILKIALGPGRSMFEWFTAHPGAAVSFDCLEIDAAAIRYASDLNRDFLDRITFMQKNVLRFRPSREYDLIWAAGICDYFNDRAFVNVLERLLPALADGGEMVVGNFSDQNPSRAYMELVGDWTLNHRSGDCLVELARQAGATSHHVTIGTEPEEVNLFLHVSRA
jgi:extracellular factor (EF) 3-hydroxypalmitic acid methyl ester biosynthesis protein